MQPLEDKAKQRYQGSQGQQYHGAKRALPGQAIPWVARFRARKLSAFVQPSDTVLEYGVGLGWNLAALECARKIGVDVGEFLRAELERQGIEFVSQADSLADAS